MFLLNLLEPITSIQILCMAFFAILFLQSGFDKVFDYQANSQYMQEHFAKSPLKSTISILFPLITLFEVLAGVCSLAGLMMFFLNETTEIGLIGVQLAAVNILMLFFGQRLAKDYQGAVTLTQYFILALIAIYMLS